ncbi:hypothetical protein DI272_01040 [Streptomyces sp. Act143]|nr:hypothetical protein DI272_01040 [Streptomyces sp. Act143]
MIVRLQLANAAMFVPFGSLLSFTFRPARKAVPARATCVCLGFSVLIEGVQFVMAAGRTVDVDDVLFNTLGGLLGAGVAVAGVQVFARARRGNGRGRYVTRAGGC